MGIPGLIMRILGSKLLRKVVSALLGWLTGECARFCAEYLPVALSIVCEAATMKKADGTPEDGIEKRRYAVDKLRATLKSKGIEAADHMLNAAVELAVSELKKHATK